MPFSPSIQNFVFKHFQAMFVVMITLLIDFDEKTTDDWDVDMEIYADPDAGDKDARDYVAMRQEKRRRDGKEDTDMFTAGIGKFEKHTKVCFLCSYLIRYIS